ncbi:MAG: MFS transporter [Clostridia bacterium]|nr:MFS transporter [Clostridia bacterium]
MKKKTNYSRFLLLWAGNMISQVGGGLTSFGLGVYIFNRTGSAAQMALVTLLGFLPTLLLSVPAGVLADLFDRRLLMMIGDGCSAIGILYILFCMNSGGAALWQICAGVFVSACFSALPEPAFKATITDLLTKEEYTKASGLTSLAGSARYLVSPVIAGLLLAAYDIRLLLIIDISTFFVTAAAAAAVRRGLGKQRNGDRERFAGSLREGWKAVHARKGVFRLILVSSVMSMFIGVIQVLSEPLVLSFADSKTLGIAETVCALGMLVTALLTGIVGIRKRHAAVLGISLALAGLFMTVFALRENIVLICISGFLFFAMLPLANSSLDYLARSNIPDELQGRAWGFIGFLSQLGYVPAFAFAGLLADRAAVMMRATVGRGSALVIGISGGLLVLVSILSLLSRRIRSLESGAEREASGGPCPDI